MTHARITDGTIDTLGNLPAGARRLDTGEWVTPPGGEWPPELAAACGWFEVTETARPADTAEGTYVSGEAVVDGLPVRTWTYRPWTVEELAAQEEQAAREADRAAIVEDALVWLAADAAAADVRAAQIAAALTGVDEQVTQVAGYTFSGTNVAGINSSLNGALKPMVQSILERQKQIGLMLQELQVARNRHGDALVWVGRYLTR